MIHPLKLTKLDTVAQAEYIASRMTHTQTQVSLSNPETDEKKKEKKKKSLTKTSTGIGFVRRKEEQRDLRQDG